MRVKEGATCQTEGANHMRHHLQLPAAGLLESRGMEFSRLWQLIRRREDDVTAAPLAAGPGRAH